MLNNKSIGNKGKHAVGFGIALVLVAVCIQQLTPAAAAQAGDPTDILVVANKSVPVDSVSLTLVRDLFLKVRKEWGKGVKALPINAKDEQLRNDFRKRVLDMDTTAEQRYFENLKIKYGQSEPPVLSNTLKAVFKLKGAVSYVYRKDFKEGVTKILFVVR